MLAEKRMNRLEDLERFELYVSLQIWEVLEISLYWAGSMLKWIQLA